MTPEIGKLIKTLRMLSADNDHLCLVAARKVHAQIVTNDWDWEQLLANGSSTTLTEEQLARVFAAGIAKGEQLGYERGIARCPVWCREGSQRRARRRRRPDPADRRSGRKQLRPCPTASATSPATCWPGSRKWGRSTYVSQRQWDIAPETETKLQHLGQL